METDKDALFRHIERRIAYYRKQRKLTQRMLALQIHRSVSTVSRIERGAYNCNIPLSTLVDIADGLNVTLEKLVKP